MLTHAICGQGHSQPRVMIRGSRNRGSLPHQSGALLLRHPERDLTMKPRLVAKVKKFGLERSKREVAGFRELWETRVRITLPLKALFEKIVVWWPLHRL